MSNASPDARSALRELVSAWLLCGLIAAAALGFTGDRHTTSPPSPSQVAATATPVRALPPS